MTRPLLLLVVRVPFSFWVGVMVQVPVMTVRRSSCEMVPSSLLAQLALTCSLPERMWLVRLPPFTTADVKYPASRQEY